MKKDIGEKNCLYPLPTALVGALVNVRPNYITMAHVGIVDPNSISLGMNKKHYTNTGTKENRSFSVNIPQESMVKVVDHCGIVSGTNEDKSALFKTFYGRLATAPRIEECPVCMECELVTTVDFPHHDLFIGKVVATYSDEEVMTGGAVDFSKIRPILLTMTNRSYYRPGERTAKPWTIGKELKSPKDR